MYSIKYKIHVMDVSVILYLSFHNKIPLDFNNGEISKVIEKSDCYQAAAKEILDNIQPYCYKVEILVMNYNSYIYEK